MKDPPLITVIGRRHPSAQTTNMIKSLKKPCEFVRDIHTTISDRRNRCLCSAIMKYPL